MCVCTNAQIFFKISKSNVLYLFAAHSSHAFTTNTQDNLTCSGNVAYDTVSNTLKMSSQAKVTFSENMAYGTVEENMKDTATKTTATHTTAVYEEVTM